MMTRSVGRPCGALVSLLFIGCSSAPALTHRTWNSLSEEEIQTRLAAPTAELPSVLSGKQISALDARMPALLQVSRFVGGVIEVVTEVANTDYSDEEGRLPEAAEAPAENEQQGWGSNLYLRLACPGPEPLQPRTDFSAGEVRLDSATIRSLDLRALISGGEFLLSFEHCQLGPLQLDARFPGRYTADVDRLPSGDGETDAPAFAMALSADDVEQGSSAAPLGMILVGCGGSGSCDDDLRVSAEFRTDAGSFVVTFRALRSFWSGEALSLTIRGADSESECEYSNTAAAGPRVTCGP